MNTEKSLAQLKKSQRKLEDALELIFDAGKLHDEVCLEGNLAVGKRFHNLREPIQSAITHLVGVQASIRTKANALEGQAIVKVENESH